ncbi:hypothetical protein [Pseudopelagicola sp. nBUS_19]|uniref:hypothetical protein n=1 Tax=Pseudopelagicola sp. nBUS_19 TaxID=3395316 RepID=UPI003EBA3127
MIGRYETNLPFTSQFPLTLPGRVLSDELELVSVYRGMRELIRNKADATRREPRFGSV